MNAKENALRIMRFDQPERVVGAPPTYTLRYQGCNHEGYALTAQAQGFSAELGDDHPVGSHWTDIWGVEWHKIHDGLMGLPKGNPLAQVEALRAYRWPDPDDERVCGRIYRLAAEFPGDDRFLAGSHRDTLWEED